MSDYCTCATPMPTTRRPDYWDALWQPRCWTCQRLIRQAGWRVRDLEAPTVQPVHDGSDHYGE